MIRSLMVVDLGRVGDEEGFCSSSLSFSMSLLLANFRSVVPRLRFSCFPLLLIRR